jgi:hypothetical protein
VEIATLQSEFNAVLMLLLNAKKNAGPKLNATAKKEFASLHQIATARLSPNISAPSQRMLMLATQLNFLPVTRDVSQQLDATQLLAKMLVPSVAALQFLLSVTSFQVI